MYPVFLSEQRHHILRINDQIKNTMAAVCTYLHFPHQHGIIKEISQRYQIPRSSFMRNVDRVINEFCGHYTAINEQLQSLKKTNKTLGNKLSKQRQHTAFYNLKLMDLT